MSEFYREIRKNRVILESRKPYSREAEETFDEWSIHQFVYSCIHLDGRNLSREEVQKILSGEVVKRATLADYARVQGIETAVLYLNRLCQERVPEYSVRFRLKKNPLEKLPTEAEFCLMWSFLEGKSEQEARKIWAEKSHLRTFSPIVRSISHVPCHFSEIREKTDDLFGWMGKMCGDPDVNPILFAAELHNRVMELYPFASDNEDMAKLAAEAVLLAYGLPLIPWSMTEPEYYGCVRMYLDSVERREVTEDGYRAGNLALVGRMEQLVNATQNVLLRLTDPKPEPES